MFQSLKFSLFVFISLLAITTMPLTTVAASAPYPLGPNLEKFPPRYNPLTGLPVSDPSWLELPAVLVSLSNFPPSVRPQTGLSFASQVYEIYITEGMTRFLAVFYGEPPRTIPNPSTSTEARQQPILPNRVILGGRVWWDENADGVQQPWEPGLGGIQVTLRDEKGRSLDSILTDGNGYYAFAPVPGRRYGLQIQPPSGFTLTRPNISEDTTDSDAEMNGVIPAFLFENSTTHQDFGLTGNISPSTSGSSSNGSLTSIEKPQDVGLSGVRSGREAYVPIANAFPGGCLVAASKSPDVNLRICRNVYGNNPEDINSAGLSVSTLRALAEANRNPQQPSNYSGNLFDPLPPTGGKMASQVNVFYAYLNQAQWKYDPVAGGYWRFQDYGKEEKAGQFTPAFDRLTGRPLLFENIVILFVEHVARRPTIIDLAMGPGSKGRAIVFRNGQIYTDLMWSMIGEDYEKQTGLSRPIRLRYSDGRPFPLAPGQTWFHVATTTSFVQEVTGQPGTWKFRFYPPGGAK